MRKEATNLLSMLLKCSVIAFLVTLLTAIVASFVLWDISILYHEDALFFFRAAIVTGLFFGCWAWQIERGNENE